MRKKVLSTLLSLCLLIGLLPTALAADNAIYVKANEDTSYVGNGTLENPFTTLAEAVLAADDRATIYVMSDLTMTKCARYYGKHLTIIGQPGENDADGVITVTRGDGFETIDDDRRSWYNPAMIEVGGKKDENDNPITQSASLRLENITFDDDGKKMGTRFLDAPVEGVSSDTIVQDAIIATYNIPMVRSAGISPSPVRSLSP